MSPQHEELYYRNLPNTEDHCHRRKTPPSRPWEEHPVHSRALLEPSWLCLWSRVFHEQLSEQMRLWSPSFAYKVNCPSHWQGMLAGEQREALVASLEHPQRLEAQERQPPLCPPALEGPRAIGRGVRAVTPTQTFLETCGRSAFPGPAMVS